MKKEANLITSPVLREFYNKALDNKWIVEEQLEKNASVSIDKYAVTGNLMQDLVNLASGLREIGLYEQAESLEVKFNLFKKAELSLSKLIDDNSRALQEMAHHDNTKIVDAQGGWGVVHTNMDRQRKILETLMHEPKAMSEGQQAVHQVALAAADALGLLKFAQDNTATGEDVESKVTEVTEVPKTFEFSANEEEADSFDAAATAEQKTSSKKINDDVQAKLNASFSGLNNIQSKCSNIQKFISKNFSLDNVNKISDFFDKISIPGKVASYEPGTTSYILTTIKPMISNVDSLYSELSKDFNPPDDKEDFDNTSPGHVSILNKYSIKLPGSEESWNPGDYARGVAGINAADQGEFGGISENSKSIYVYSPGVALVGDQTIELSPQNITALVQEIKNKCNQIIKDYITNKISAISSKLTEEALTVNSNIVNIASSLLEIKPIYFSSKETYKNIFSAKKKAQDYLKEFNKKSKDSLLNFLYDDLQLISTISVVVDNLNSLLNNINENPVNPREKIITDAEFKNIISPLARALRTYQNYIDQNADSISTSEESKINNTISKIKSIAGALNTAKKQGGTIQDFREILGEPELRTFNTIIEFTSKVEKSANDYVNKKAKADYQFNKFIKSAGMLGDVPSPSGNVSGKANGSSSSSSGGSVSGGGGYKPAQLTEGQRAVQEMQYALHKLGGAIIEKRIDKKKPSDPSLIMNVGRTGGAITDFDGNWGPNVDVAVKTANTYVTNLNTTSGAQLKRDDSVLKKAAEDNAEKILSFLTDKGVSTGAATRPELAVLDNIPILFGDGSDQVSMDGNIPVRIKNLISLKDFYKFIKANMPGIVDDATPVKWNHIFTYFSNRASKKYSEARTSGQKSLMMLYKRYVDALYVKFSSLVKNLQKQFNLSDQETLDMIISEQDFVSGQPGSDSIGGAGAGFGAGRGEGRGGRPGGSGMGEGGGIDSGETLQVPTAGAEAQKTTIPFTNKTLYLKSQTPDGQLYFIKSSSIIPTKTFIQYDDFNLTDAPEQLVNKFFTGQATEEDIVQQYKKLRPDLAINVDNSGNYFVGYFGPGQGATSIPLNNFPDFINQKNQITGSLFLIKLRDLLTILKQEISTSEDTYVGYLTQKYPDKVENYASIMSTNSRRWLTAIDNHLIKINRKLAKVL